jgi:hypothetical protein
MACRADESEVKGWQLVAAFVGAGFLWSFIAIPPFERATTRTSAYLARAVFAEPQIAAFVTALGLRNGIVEGSAGVDADGSAPEPAGVSRVVARSMREWQFRNPIDRWLPRAFLALHDLYFRFARNIGLRRPFLLDTLRYDEAQALRTLRGTPAPPPGH